MRPRLSLSLVLFLVPGAAAQETPEPEDLVPGLIAEFRDLGDPALRVLRVASSPSGDWGSGSPDLRLRPDRFEASWDGWLLVRTSGSHRFHLHAEGDARVIVDGRTVARSGSGSEPVMLRPGLKAFRVAYRPAEAPARLSVDWEGPGFGREHLPAHLLYHERAASPGPDRFEAGRRLADRLGCAGCHAIADLPAHRDLGPPLDDAGSIRPSWLRRWIADPTALRPGSRMPAFGLDRDEADDLNAFLLGVAAPKAEAGDEVRMALHVAEADRGRLLFRSAGCLGCHPVLGATEGPELDAAPDLEGLGSKRSAGSIATYLAGVDRADPGRHRPILGLNADAAAHLAALLGPDADSAGIDDRPAPSGDPVRGRALAISHRCAACHEVPGIEPDDRVGPLRSSSDPEAGCLADEVPRGLPRFALGAIDRGNLRHFVEALPEGPAPTPPTTHAADSVRRRNCLGCHARDGMGAEDLGARLARLLAEDRELNTLKGSLTPPDLSGVGDKLRPDYLLEAIEGEAPTARPWLSVRMPRFRFDKGEAEAIAAMFRSLDRIEREPEPPPEPGPIDAGGGIALLGRRGFGCVSCHVLEGKIPPGGEPETLGPDLALTHRRMSRTYYRRWLSDPQRIIPGTPMPQFLLPAPGNPGTLDEQLDALWNALGDARLAALASDVGRQSLERRGDRPLVVRDMVVTAEGSEGYRPRGIAIGLLGDRSLLFDADRLAWVRWWDGGFLYRTKQGRLWEWHPEGRTLWNSDGLLPPVAFLGAESIPQTPDLIRERFGSFDALEFDGPAVRLEYRLQRPGGGVTSVTERIAPNAIGWERSIELNGAGDGTRPVAVASAGPGPRLGPGSSWSWDSVAVQVAEGGAPTITRLDGDDDGDEVVLVPMLRRDDGAWSCRLRIVVAR